MILKMLIGRVKEFSKGNKVEFCEKVVDHPDSWMFKDGIDSVKVVCLEIGQTTGVDTIFHAPKSDVLITHGDIRFEGEKIVEKVSETRSTFKKIICALKNGEEYSIVTNGEFYLLNDEGKTIERL